MPETVTFDVHRGVATITMDSPQNRNALSAHLRAELSERLRVAINDDAIRAVVLTHTGTVFCSGADLKEKLSEQEAANVVELDVILKQIYQSPKPVVARVAGPARAGGIGLIAVCDLAVAAESASFAFSEVRLGVVPAVISVSVLPRLAPRAAHELFLTAETFDAERAVEIGLLNSVVSDSRLDEEVNRYVGMLVLGAPGALAATKSLLIDRQPDLAARLAEMAKLSATYFASPEGREGMTAFIEKRPPSWAPV